MALLIFAVIVALIVPLALALATPSMERARLPGAERQQSLKQSLVEAFSHRSYVLLVMGFFTCGFQLFFITVHLPAYLVDRGLSVADGAWTLAAIGLFNIIGSLLAGYLSDKIQKRYILSAIYFARSLAIVAFITLPASPASAIMFGAAMGLLWLSTVPPTNGLIVVMFGTRWLTMLAGMAFFSHQVGGFLGVWLGGILYERTGSYDVVWWGAIALGLISALINLPIVEKPVPRMATAAA
jgi:predicted MFS family arabinose efflux permease